MKKISIIITASCALTLALGACSNEEEIPVESQIEEVETSEEDAIDDAIENAESAADAMGQELSDATAPEIVPAPPVESAADAAQ